MNFAYKKILISFFSALLFSLSWPAIGNQYYFIFIAWVPLLILEDLIYNEFLKGKIKKHYLQLFSFSYFSFFLWNLACTWWIYYATAVGMVLAVLANSFLMSLFFLIYHYVRLFFGLKRGLFAFIFSWLCYEYIHLHWELAWPWLTLGHVFSLNEKWIQWYEFTGVLGGSLWILIVNVLFFLIIKYLKKVYFIVLLFTILIPIFFSISLFNKYNDFATKSKRKINVLAVQPNIDPYYDKFSNMTVEEQFNKMMKLIRNKITKDIDYVVGPETALAQAIWENKINDDFAVKKIRDFLRDSFPDTKFVLGISSYKYYGKNKLSSTARKFLNSNEYYDAFNTAIQIDTSNYVQIYHKSKLVLGVEQIPYSYIFKPLENLALNLGGITGSLGKDKHPTVFFTFLKKDTAVSIAPVICYESIFGEYVGKYIKRGANFIFVITNDGWWKNTPGYKQHFLYAKLLAIECRREIVRSANTGISGFINIKGQIMNKTKWWTDDAITNSLSYNNKKTYYVLKGDYIGRISSFIVVMYILFTIVKKYNTTGNRLIKQ